MMPIHQISYLNFAAHVRSSPRRGGGGGNSNFGGVLCDRGKTSWGKNIKSKRIGFKNTNRAKRPAGWTKQQRWNGVVSRQLTSSSVFFLFFQVASCTSTLKATQLLLLEVVLWASATASGIALRVRFLVVIFGRREGKERESGAAARWICRGSGRRWARPWRLATATTLPAPSRDTPTPLSTTPARPSPRAQRSFKITLYALCFIYPL